MLRSFVNNSLQISKYRYSKIKTLNHIRHFSIFKNENEKQYLNLVENVIYNGEKRYTRNGYTYSIFGYQMKYNLKNNTLPLLTTKKVAWKSCLKELLWFISGKTNNKILKSQNVHIWNDNSTREFLDSRGLFYYDEDELGPIYGHQWRKFNAPYNLYHNTINEIEQVDNMGVDQVQYIIDCLTNKNKEGPYSRRLIVSAWNPCQLDIMALPPCHVLFQFYLNTSNELSCQLYQRSGDIGLGIPFNIASYGFLTHLIAKHCGLNTGYFIHTIGDAHIYEEHIEPLKEQLERTPYNFPKVYISEKRENINDYIFDDFKVVDYKYHSQIKMPMKA